MFGIKTQLKKLFQQRLLRLLRRSTLSEKGMQHTSLISALTGARMQLENELADYGKDHPVLPVLNPVSQQVRKLLAKYNPNNLGNWQNFPVSHLSATAEKDALEIYKKLLKAPKNISGYFTAGATEANIFCAWAGKTKLKQQGISLNKIVLIRNSFSHYSVEKAAKITELTEALTPFSLENWNVDTDALIETLKKLYQQGMRGYLLPLTLGYTAGGTEDSAEKITQLLNAFQKQHAGVRLFVWIDAAYSGISKPFLEKRWHPFSSRLIQAVAADFHKVLGVSYPAGVLLHRKELSGLIETAPSYIPQKDQAVLGSRPGMPALEVFFTFQFYGKRKLQNIFLAAVKKKEIVLKKLAAETAVKVVTQPSSFQAALISKRPFQKKLLKKYHISQNRQYVLTETGNQIVYYCKLYFLPKF